MPTVILVGCPVDRLPFGRRHGLINGVAQERVAEADTTTAVTGQDAAIRQPLEPDAGVELRLDGRARPLELLQHALHLVAAELGAQHRNEPRVRREIGRQ